MLVSLHAHVCGLVDHVANFDLLLILYQGELLDCHQELVHVLLASADALDRPVDLLELVLVIVELVLAELITLRLGVGGIR